MALGSPAVSSAKVGAWEGFKEDEVGSSGISAPLMNPSPFAALEIFILWA